MAGLYLHIPFCVSKCNYCDFLSFAGNKDDIDRYAESLCREMELRQDSMATTLFETVYIGGGTPSFLPLGAVPRIMDSLRRYFTVSAQAEITIESNPDSLDAQKAKEYVSCGINRVSVGLQSANDVILKRLGRPHTKDQFLRAAGYLQDAGFSNINADVMYGLPGQTRCDYIHTLETAAQTGVTHLSAYSLLIEEGTPFFKRKAEGELSLPDEEEEWEMERAGREIMDRYGFSRYEVSNYAKDGCRCLHNMNYWQNGEYLGLGLGAHSRIGNERFSNDRNLASYPDTVAHSKLPVCETRTLSREDDMFESVMMGLRLCEGLDTEMFASRFGVEFEDAYGRAVKSLKASGLLTVHDNRAALTSRGMDIMNSVLLSFLP